MHPVRHLCQVFTFPRKRGPGSAPYLQGVRDGQNLAERSFFWYGFAAGASFATVVAIFVCVVA